MKKLSIKNLNEKDEETVYALISLGLNRYVARSITYLQYAKEVKAVDLERGAGLRQPEVSIAMKELEKRGWINEREEKKQGKGRPSKLYSLKVDFSDIIAQLENDQKKAQEDIEEKIKILKGLK